MSNKLRTRLEIEDELEKRSQKIVESVNRIKEEFTLARSPVVSFAKDHPLTTVGAALVLGLATSWLIRFERRGYQRSRKAPVDPVDQYAESLKRRMESEKAEGRSEDEALRRALKQLPPPSLPSVPSGQSQSGILEGPLRRLTHSVAGAAVDLVVDQFTSLLLELLDRKDRPANTQESTANH